MTTGFKEEWGYTTHELLGYLILNQQTCKKLVSKVNRGFYQLNCENCTWETVFSCINPKLEYAALAKVKGVALIYYWSLSKCLFWDSHNVNSPIYKIIEEQSQYIMHDLMFY